MKYLFLITINPVQSFIEQARKVHDLAASSDMLSFFMKEIAVFIESTASNSKQLFPHKATKAYPHRLLFALNIESVEEIKNLGIETEKQFKRTLNLKIDDYIKPLNTDSFETARNQIHQVFKLYWVALDYEDNNFKTKYNEIDKLLGSVKNVRPFQQYPEKGRKCSLNGEYNVVAYRYKDENEEQNDKDLVSKKVLNHKKQQKRAIKWLEYTRNVTCLGRNCGIDLKKISDGEALSGISFLKRNWPKNSFDATCEIAYLDAKNKLQKYFKTNRNPFERIKDIDEQYIYEDAIISENHKVRKDEINSLRNEILKASDEYKKETKIKSKLKLGKYYAVLMFDADTMGKWISDDGKLKVDTDLQDFQDKLSGKFVAFADEATEYVNGKNENGKKGQVIYAGGDDFLALIGLEYLFDVLIHLRIKFNEIINSEDINKFKLNENEKITFSAGIAIAHYKTPLSFVLGEARKAEHTAKEEGDRNAFAITVLKRSGEIKKAFHKFGHDNCNLEILAELLKMRQNDVVSRTFINHFAAEFKPLITDDLIEELNSPALIEKEFKRLLKSSMKQKENYSNKFASELFSLIEIQTKHNLQNLIDFLFTIDFISREINEPLKPEANAN
jgi:CRISPR-associated protein Cmr2